VKSVALFKVASCEKASSEMRPTRRSSGLLNAATEPSRYVFRKCFGSNRLGSLLVWAMISPIGLSTWRGFAGLSASLLYQACQHFLAERISLAAKLTPELDRVLFLEHPG